MAEFSLQATEKVLAAWEGVPAVQAEWGREGWSSGSQRDSCPEKYNWETQRCRCWLFCSCLCCIVLFYGSLKKNIVAVADPEKCKKLRDLTCWRCLLNLFGNWVFICSIQSPSVHMALTMAIPMHLSASHFSSRVCMWTIPLFFHS